MEENGQKKGKRQQRKLNIWLLKGSKLEECKEELRRNRTEKQHESVNEKREELVKMTTAAAEKLTQKEGDTCTEIRWGTPKK